MRLKQCIFALVAMLLCAFSATAQVTTEAALKEALTAGGEVTLGADITTTAAITTSGVTSVIDLNGKTLTIGAGDNKFYDASDITIKNGTISITGVTVGGNAIFCLDEYEKTLVTTLTLDNVNLVGEGYSSAYCIFYIGNSSVLNIKGGVWNLKNDASTAGGVFKADASAATLNIDGLQLTAHNVRRVVTYAATTIANSTLAISGDADGVDAEMEHGFNRSPLVISNSTITMTDMVGRGITAENGAVTISGNSTVTMTNCQEATIDVRNGQTVTIDNTSTVAVDKEPTISSGSTISGTVKLPVVAKIGDVEYSDFAAALTAASKMSGDVTVEVYDKVTLNTAFSGSYSSINFVGKDTDAEIYLDVQGYITATGKKVSFTDLTLSKSEGDYLTNAGFMNVAFGIYDVVEVTYTNCVFANGAYASSGNVTYTGCTFKKSWEKYGLWAYGNVNVAVEGCKFDNDRGIKMYAEDKAKTTDLTVRSCDFSALTGKPAIVLTYGESVVLEGNTYSSTGTFELDLDGAPNGTAVTSDVAPTCKNDNGTCGVLVDGKIYTTVAQAAEVAAEGSNVTLLYSTTDAVEFAEGVNLTLANGVTAENVTVATSGVAQIGETKYATLAEALAAVGAGDVVIELLDDVTLDYGAREAYGTAETTSVTINGNGKTLTLNQTNSDWSSFGLAAGKVAFNNVTIEKTGYGDTSGAWNTHAIIFSCPVEMNNVTVNNGIAVQAGATLNNVTINEANGYYGLWVNGNGQTVTMNGGAINATNGGRGIKVADQYIDTPAQVTLNVTGTAFNTAKKAAVLVSSTAGAKIAASNVDITNVAADNQSMVWVDEDWAANYGAVEVTGATVAQEAAGNFAAAIVKDGAVKSYFKTLQEAIDAVQNGETIEFLGDITEALVTIEKASGVAFTIDGKGNSFTGEFEIGIGENINIQNINFVASAEISPEYFIDSMDKNSNCVLNITGCTFTDTDYSTTAIGTHQPTKVVIDGCTTSGVASLLQNQGGYNITVKNTTVEGKRGISLGTVVGATVEKVTIKAADDKYGIRLNGEIANNTITIKDCDIQAFIPVVVRKAQVENYNVIFDGTNTMTAKNTDGLWCAIGASEYEENGVMPDAQTGKITVTLNDTGLSKEGVYGNYFIAVAKIGDVEYETLAEAIAAAESGATITLMNGEHELPAFSNKELTFVGESKDGVIVNDAPDARTQGWVGSTIHFENLTAKGATANYHGLANGVVAVTYKDCNINGLRFLYADTVSFEGCAFNAEGVEHSFWTYGSSNITVKNSTFTYTDRAVNCYSENGAEHEADITFEGCSFTYAGTADAPEGAVEINSGSVKSIDLTMNDCTAPEKGAMWFNSQWDSNNGENTVVTVNDVKVWPLVAQVGETKYADLQAAIDAATEGQTITLLADVTLEAVVETKTGGITIDLNEKTVTGADGAVVFNIKAATAIKNGTILGNKSGTSSGLIDIYANLAMDGVTLETSKINALRFKAGDCTATLDNCNITGAFKGYGTSVWAINSGTYKAASTAISEQLNGTAQISGGTFHYEITDEKCAPGYSVVNNGDGTYTVKYAPVCFVDTNNNGTLDEGETVYGSLAAVFNTIKEGDVYIVLTDNTAIAEQVDTDADAKYYLNTNVAEGVTVDFAFAEDWNYVQKMYVGKGVTLNAPYLLAWTDLEVHGTINTGYLYTTVANVVIAEGGVVNATTGDATVQVKNGATLTVNGELNTSTLNVWAGESKLIVSGANAKVNAKWVDIWDGTPVVDVENGATLAVENIKASRGGSIEVADATLAATGTIELGHNGESTGTLTETGNSTITGNIKLTVEGSTVKSDGGLTNVTTDLEGYGVVYENGEYKVVALPDYVAMIGETGYATLAEALTAAQEGETVTLVWAEGNDPIAMNGAVFGKNVTITGTATVDWSKGNLFVGRGGEGNATVTFDGANLTSASNSASTGIHVSGREKDTNNKYDGTLVIKNSTIELDYLINKNTMSLDNSTLTVKNGFSIGGRPASETESGADATATISLANNSKVIVNNHNGMGLGYEAIGVMNIDETSTFEATQAFLVTAKGTMNVAASGAVSVNGTLTVNGTLVSAGNIAAEIAAGDGATIEISGGVYTQNVNEWCIDGYVALPDLNGNYVVGAKPTATVNNLGMTTVAAGDYMVYGSGDNTADMPLSFVMQFLADQTEADMATSPYAEWYGDFVITFTGIENGSFTADGCYLAGHYGDFGWVKVPVDGMTIEEGVRYPVMLGVGMGQKYDYICSGVQDFKCALYLTPEILEANPNIQVKLELGLVDNSKGSDAAASALINNENVYSVTDYTYDAEDFVVDPNYIAELVIDDAEAKPYTYDTEMTVGKLTYKRTLPAAGIWYPVFLPFDVPVDALDADLFNVARINDLHTNFSEEDGLIEKMWVEYIVRKSGTLAAGKPFLIKAKSSDALEMVIELEDVTLYPADKKSNITVSSVITEVTFEGVYESLDAPVSTPSTRYLAVNADGVWDEFDGYSLNPFRVMMTLKILDEEYYIGSTASLSVGARVIGEENEDGTTVIYEVEVDRENDGAIYDLQGRRVLETEKGGMYIVNGKKVLVK